MPDIKDVPEIRDENPSGSLTAGEVRELLDEAMKDELRRRRDESAASFLAGMNRRNRIVLLVFVNGKCIGKKTAGYLEARGPEGIAVKLYRRYAEKWDVRVVAAIGDEQILIAPDDGSFIGNRSHYEAHPEEYGAPEP